MEFIATPWGFSSIAVIAATLITVVWRVGYLSLSKAGLLIGKGGVQKKPSPHATCPHAGDIMEFLHRTAEHLESKQELKTQLIEGQMRFYEETEEEIIGVFKRIYLSLLGDKLADQESYAQHPEYTSYAVTLLAIASELKSCVRGWFKANHYALQTPEEQRIYIDKKKLLSIQKVTDALNLYWRGSVVTRTDLYKAHKQHMGEFEKLVEEIFNKAFLLARETANTLERLDIEYNQYLNEKLGQ